EGADDVVGGAAQQADCLRAWRIGSDDQGACLGDLAKARRREPYPGRDRGGEDCRRPVAARHAVAAIERVSRKSGYRFALTLHKTAQLRAYSAATICWV